MKFQVSSFKFQVPRTPAASPRPRVPASNPFIIHHSSFIIPHPRAFSLVEVLLAIFILGIGMIMVASVFPVGATWTRQTTEDSVAQTVAQDALSVLQRHYGDGGDLRVYLEPDYLTPSLGPNLPNLNSILQAGVNAGAFPTTLPHPPTPPPSFVLQAPPGFIQIPLTERAYQFGSANPFPALNPLVCTYFWTALMRLNPAHAGGTVATNGIMPSSSYKYDVYILVFRKGSAEQGFSVSSSEILGTRSQLYMPSVVYNQYVGTPVTGAIPPMGQYGIGAFSGTVFRQVLSANSNYTNAMPQPYLLGQPVNQPQEPIIFSPPAAGTATSPLIYIYQTTMSF